MRLQQLDCLGLGQHFLEVTKIDQPRDLRRRQVEQQFPDRHAA